MQFSDRAELKKTLRSKGGLCNIEDGCRRGDEISRWAASSEAEEDQIAASFDESFSAFDMSREFIGNVFFIHFRADARRDVLATLGIVVERYWPCSDQWAAVRSSNFTFGDMCGFLSELNHNALLMGEDPIITRVMDTTGAVKYVADPLTEFDHAVVLEDFLVTGLSTATA
jgi:hypothetical protein